MILRSHNPSSMSAPFNGADVRDDGPSSVPVSFKEADASDEFEALAQFAPTPANSSMTRAHCVMA